MFNDLRGFINVLENLGELKRVKGAHWDLEIGAITELVAERKGPALLFDEVPGYPPGYRVLSNAFCNLTRTAIALNLDKGLKPLDMLNAWRLSLRERKPVPPVEVKDGPLTQNVHTGKDVDLFMFPSPKWHEADGGRFPGTGCAVITRDPDEGWVNLGTYRVGIKDKNTMAVAMNVSKHGRIMMEKYHAKGLPCPIAVSCGHDPHIFVAASDTAVRWGQSEYNFAGAIKGEPIEVIKGEITGLPLPATAEIVIEGEVPVPGTHEPIDEGPFGEWAGYYGYKPVGLGIPIVVKSIMHRNDPIILGAPPLKPPALERVAIPTCAAAIWDQLEGADIPGVKGVWLMTFENPLWIVIALKQSYLGHAKQAALAAGASRAGCYAGKFVVVVDEDVDITDPNEVLWAMGAKVNVDKINIVRNLGTSPSDFGVPWEMRNTGQYLSSRMYIDACTPFKRDQEIGPVNRFSESFRKQTIAKWPTLFK